MRIPTSVVVMSLVTAVPFGLAVRDTLRHHDGDDDALDFDGSRAQAKAERAYQERLAEEERQAAADAEKSRALHTKIRGMLAGTTPASMGSLFDGIALGAPAGSFQPEAARQRIQDAAEVVSVDFDTDAVTLTALRATITDHCDDVDRELTRLWGAPNELHVWVDPAHHQRASFDDCTLRFERYVEVTQWIDQSTSAVIPLALIGRPVAELEAKLGTRDVGRDPDGLAWDEPGVGSGTGPTKLLAIPPTGAKLTTLTAEFEADATTIDAITARVTKLVGRQPKTDPETGAITWAGKLPVTLSVEGRNASLVAGKQTP